MLNEDNLRRLEELERRYPTKKALTLPVLWMVQEQFGWISPETMKFVAGMLDVPLSHIYGVVTFYTMFNTKPVGKYHLQICTNVSCQLLGGAKLMDHVCTKLGVKPGQTTLDKKFTVTEVECLGSCGTSPMMQVNDEYHENLSLERVDSILEKLG